MTPEEAIEKIRAIIADHNKGKNTVYYTIGAIEGILEQTK